MVVCLLFCLVQEEEEQMIGWSPLKHKRSKEQRRKKERKKEEESRGKLAKEVVWGVGFGFRADRSLKASGESKSCSRRKRGNGWRDCRKATKRHKQPTPRGEWVGLSQFVEREEMVAVRS